MNHQLFPSVSEMIAPDTLSDLLGDRVTAVSTHPLLARYNKSGSRLLRVEVNHGQGTQLILKHVNPANDWLMRTTHDVHCRSVMLWQYGLLDQLPPEIDHALIACAHDDEGWALLLRDVSDSLLPYTPFSKADNVFIMKAMASLHAAFFESPLLQNPALGLCNISHVYTMFSPKTGKCDERGEDEVPCRILEGWQMIKTAVDADVTDVIFMLLDNPKPLCDALNRYPKTLVHGDWRHANQGLIRQENGRSQLILLDWQLAVAAPPAVELGRSLGTNSPLLPVSKEETIDIYKQQFAQLLGSRFADSWWEPQLALGLLGGFLQDGWAIVLKATHWHVGAGSRKHWQADLGWWSEQVRKGVEWL